LVPGLDEMGIRILLNECEPIFRGGEIYLAGIDDAHYYQVDNIEKAGCQAPNLFCGNHRRPQPRFQTKVPSGLIYSFGILSVTEQDQSQGA
jgi:hypothetical protein